MKKILLLVFLLAVMVAPVMAGTITGQIQTPSSGRGVANGTLTFTLSQAAVVSGTATLAGNGSCWTDSGGNVVGLPGDAAVAAPVLSSNLGSGSLGSGTYFVRYTWANATGESQPSGERSLVLGSSGTLVVQAPVNVPAPATSMKVYIGTASGGETLQGSVAVSNGVMAGNYSQAAALVAGAALPSSNTSACQIRFNDELQPSYTAYSVAFTNVNGAGIAGFPQKWYLSGGSNGTVNVSSGTPLYSGVVVYPQAIVSNPAANGTQSINGPLSLNGFGLTAQGVNGDLWVGPGAGQYTSMAACYAAASIGQTCHVPFGWTETWSANLVMNKNDVGFALPCGLGSAGINMNGFNLQISDGIGGAFITSDCVFGGYFVVNSRFRCTGTVAACFQIGTSSGGGAAEIKLKGFTLDFTGASPTAVGIDTYALSSFRFEDLYISGTSNLFTAANTQIALRMSPGASFDGEAGVSIHSNYNAYIGVQLNNVTYKTFVETNNAVAANASALTAVDCNGCGAIRYIGGGSDSIYTTSVAFRNGAAWNYFVTGCESSTNAATFDGTVSNNYIFCTNGGNFHDPSFANGQTSNTFVHGNKFFSGAPGSGSPITIYATNGFPTLGFVSPTGGQNNKNWDILSQTTQLNLRGVSDDNSVAQSGLTINKAAAGANGYQIASVVIGTNTSNKVPFYPDTTTFTNLPSVSNGGILYCSDCTIANPCAGSGTGAIAKRLNNAWVCN